MYARNTGESHHKTGIVYYKVAGHLPRTGFPQDTMSQPSRGIVIQSLFSKSCRDRSKPLKEAPRVFQSGTDQSFHQGEIARTTYKMGMVLIAAGQVRDGEEHIKKAEDLRRAILGEKFLPAQGESAYDELVSPWAL